MCRLNSRSFRFLVLPAVLACFALAAAAQISPDLYSGVQWRSIGPYHGGRVAAITGVVGDVSQVGVFYAGMPQGGIWKTTSAGTTWFPIFDQMKEVDSIGSIEVAPSDPNIIYAGSGDAITQTPADGNGMYKSTDAGKTWVHIGLEGTRRIPSIMVDPKNPDIVVVAAMQGTTGNQHGIFRTDNGGKTWTNVLHPDDRTGGRDLSSPFEMPNVIFATTIEDPAGAGGGGGGGGGRGAAAPAGPTYTRLYKSLDEGKTWTEIPSNPNTSGRTSVAVAMHTNGQRVFEIGPSGLFRSDDQGATWKAMAANDSRLGRGAYTQGLWVDTENPDVVFAYSTAAYKSTDGGATFKAFKGAPGGEDFHELWIDPTNDHRMAMGVDQGAPVSLDAGLTWSSYYALPNDQVYHISTDNRYPYWVMASQQDTGAVMTRSRGDGGDISETDWSPLASSEFGTITADPTDPNIIYGVGYGAGQGSGLIKINMTTGQWDNINPSFGADASLYGASSRDQWRRFDPFDPHTMYADATCLIVSHDQGHSWTAFSPMLTTAKGQPQEKCGTPAPAGAAGGRGARGARGAGAAPAAGAAAAGAAAPPAAAGAAAAGAAAAAAGGRGGGGGGSISDFAISTLQKGVFWTVSSNGQVFNSMDAGKTWNNVTNFTDATGVTFNTIEAGHVDLNTAYISGRIGGGRGGGAAGDSNAPQIWRTHDGGKSWTKIVNGLPADQVSGSWVNVIREDPKQKGLLFAGTESAVYVSFDDGDHWQSLQNNMPTTSIRDMVFHTDDHMSDLVVGTYGRSFYVLDDTTPLRELATKAQQIASSPAYLFKPGDAIRSRLSNNWDQPENPELPHAANPPFGAIFYYYLGRPPQGEIKLQVYDSANNLIRTISSIPPVLPESWPYPDYWVARPEDLALPTKVGMNRWNWDLRYDDPPSFSQDLENQMNIAVPLRNTPGPHGILANPGTYTFKLIVDGATYTQTVVVHNDPRVGESAKVMAGLQQKHQLMLAAYNLARDSFAGNGEVAAVRAQVAALSKASLPADVAAQATAFDTKLATFGGVAPGRGGRGGGGGGGGRGGAPAPAGGVTPFNGLNQSVISVISLQQNGSDEAPTQAVIDTYQSACKNYNATLAAWKTMLAQDLPAFNAVLSKNNVQPLSVTPTRLTDPPCTFAPPAAAAARGN